MAFLPPTTGTNSTFNHHHPLATGTNGTFTLCLRNSIFTPPPQEQMALLHPPSHPPQYQTALLSTSQKTNNTLPTKNKCLALSPQTQKQMILPSEHFIPQKRNTVPFSKIAPESG